jgi:hypothetical protein
VSAPAVTIPVPLRPALLAWLRSVPLARASHARSEAARLRALAARVDDEAAREAIEDGAAHCDEMAEIEERAAARWGGE